MRSGNTLRINDAQDTHPTNMGAAPDSKDDTFGTTSRGSAQPCGRDGGITVFAVTVAASIDLLQGAVDLLQQFGSRAHQLVRDLGVRSENASLAVPPEQLDRGVHRLGVQVAPLLAHRREHVLTPVQQDRPEIGERELLRWPEPLLI